MRTIDARGWVAVVDMTESFARLEELPTRELHERAMERAKHNWDLVFLWRVVRAIPAAEAVAGNMSASEAGVAQLSGLLSEVFTAHENDPRLQEALRPLYIDYLSRHPES